MTTNEVIEKGVIKAKRKYLLNNIYFTIIIIGIITAFISLIIGIIRAVDANTGFTIKEFVYGSLYNSMDTKKYYLAHCEGDIYVSVPETYYSTKIKLDKTEEITWYRVDSSYYKVSNKGWVYNGN